MFEYVEVAGLDAGAALVVLERAQVSKRRAEVRDALAMLQVVRTHRHQIPADKVRLGGEGTGLVDDGVPVWLGRRGTRGSAGLDLDHTDPYRWDGTRDQTRPDNLGPLRRKAHRAKTHAGWRVTQIRTRSVHLDQPARPPLRGHHRRPHQRWTPHPRCRALDQPVRRSAPARTAHAPGRRAEAASRTQADPDHATQAPPHAAALGAGRAIRATVASTRHPPEFQD